MALHGGQYMKLGERGEGLAVQFLKNKGYKIIAQNFKTRIGEIDIIASEGDTLVFVEVKTRESIAYGKPFEAVNYFKKRKIANVAMLYLKKMNEIPPCRFDVVSIHYEQGKPDCELIRDAFEV
jgi:putative endonuclease